MILSDFYLFRLTERHRKIAQNHPDPPRNHTQLIKTHKEQDKSSIVLYFLFPTDWGACGTIILLLILCQALSRYYVDAYIRYKVSTGKTYNVRLMWIC